MAIAHVQTVNSGGLSVGTISATLTLTAGNAVVVNLLTYSQAVTPTQTAGDTLTIRKDFVSGGLRINQYDSLSVAGGSTTFTFTFATVSAVRIFVTEISGLAKSAAFDVSADGGADTTSTTHSSGTTATTAQANEICIAAMNSDGAGGSGSNTVSQSFTIPTNGDAPGTDSGGLKSTLAYKIVSATGTFETTFTSLSTDGDAIICTYKAAVLLVSTFGLMGVG